MIPIVLISIGVYLALNSYPLIGGLLGLIALLDVALNSTLPDYVKVNQGRHYE